LEPLGFARDGSKGGEPFDFAQDGSKGGELVEPLAEPQDIFLASGHGFARANFLAKSEQENGVKIPRWGIFTFLRKLL